MLRHFVATTRKSQVVTPCFKLSRHLATKVKPTSKTSTKKGQEKEVIDRHLIAPVNIFKDGTDPLLKPLADYPSWVASLHKRPLTFAELERLGDARTDAQDDRLLKLVNRKRIKEKNQESWT